MGEDIMKVSELIKQLEKIQKQHGDIEVFLLSDGFDFEKIDKVVVGLTDKNEETFYEAEEQYNDEKTVVVVTRD